MHRRRAQTALAPGGHGKSGGVRVIYYYYDECLPLYLLPLFAKGDRANPSKAERDDLTSLTEALVGIWKTKGRTK